MLLHVVYMVYIASNDLTQMVIDCVVLLLWAQNKLWYATLEIKVFESKPTLMKNMIFYRNCLIDLSLDEITSNKQYFALYYM